MQCKNEVRACVVAQGCANLATRKEKKTCKRTCKTSIVTACKAPSPICSGSPSGGFVDASRR